MAPEPPRFLDTLVIRAEDGHILFDLFSKPRDKPCYLHYTSNHPDKLKISGPYSQFLRLKRICTRTADFEKHASNLVTFYERRNYPKHVIMDNLQKARAQDRKSLLKPPPPKPPKQRTEYNSYSPTIRASYPSREPYIGQKISNQLIRAEFTSTHSGKTGKTYLNPIEDCKKANCRYCPRMNKSKYCTCTYTGYRYATKLRGHCTTRNLVYLITCKNCAKQYVGETKREFKFRMAEHIRDTRVKRETPVSIHFNEPGHSFENMIFQIIQMLPTDPEDDRSTTRRRI